MWWDQVVGPDAMILVFWMLSFKPTFSLSFTFIKMLFSSSLLSAIRVVSSAYLKLLIFLLAIFLPSSASSSPAFLMMYSASKFNKQGDNIQPWCTPFPIWNQSVFPCLVPTVASWLAYRFLRRQVRWSGIPISFRIFQFIVIHTVKDFGIVNKAEMFFWNSLIFPMIQQRGPLGEMKVGLIIDWRFVHLPLPITSYTFILKIEHGTNVRFTKSSTHSHILAYIQPLFSEPQLCGTPCSGI